MEGTVTTNRFLKYKKHEAKSKGGEWHFGKKFSFFLKKSPFPILKNSPVPEKQSIPENKKPGASPGPLLENRQSVNQISLSPAFAAASRFFAFFGDFGSSWLFMGFVFWAFGRSCLAI